VWCCSPTSASSPGRWRLGCAPRSGNGSGSGPPPLAGRRAGAGRSREVRWQGGWWRGERRRGPASLGPTRGGDDSSAPDAAWTELKYQARWRPTRPSSASPSWRYQPSHRRACPPGRALCRPCRCPPGPCNPHWHYNPGVTLGSARVARSHRNCDDRQGLRRFVRTERRRGRPNAGAIFER
jgi:hypothetical protein